MKYVIIFSVCLILITGCSQNCKGASETAGMNQALLKIKTSPTNARIFIDGEYMGKSPLKYKVWYNEEKKINLVAEPIEANQFPQNVYLNVPPVPKKITLYMDKKPVLPYQIEEQEAELTEEKKISEPIIKTVFQEKIIEKVIPLILPVIFFDLDKQKILLEETVKLDQLAKVMIENPLYNLNIYGYADEQGDIDYNQKLSLLRANAIAEYLTLKEIAAERLIIYGRGEQRIINQDGKNSDFANSRRVDFQLFIPENKKGE